MELIGEEMKQAYSGSYNLFFLSNHAEELIPIGTRYKRLRGSINVAKTVGFKPTYLQPRHGAPNRRPTKEHPPYINSEPNAGLRFGSPLFVKNENGSYTCIPPIVAGSAVDTPRRGRPSKKSSLVVTLNYPSNDTQNLLTSHFPKNVKEPRKPSVKVKREPTERKRKVDSEISTDPIAKKKAKSENSVRKKNNNSAAWIGGVGCWTCRIRHKSCPQDGEECLSCIRLGLFCDRSAEKPKYMMNKETCRKVKRDIKERTDMARRNWGKLLSANKKKKAK